MGNGGWRVTIAVPRSLHKKLGTRLKRSLQTDSLAVANQMKWQAVADLKAIIDHATGATDHHKLRREALEMAAYLQRAQTDEERERLDFGISLRADELAGDPVATEVDPESGGPLYELDPDRAKLAGDYVRMVRGEMTPLDHYHSAYLAQLQVKPRTRADDERALAYLVTWCERERVPPDIQSISRKVAVRFMDGLHTVAGSKSPVTLQKYLNRLGCYWKWLLHREHVASNVWQGLKYAKPVVAHDELERPFSKDEMLRLLKGPAPEAMHDLMRIAALTGARIDPIVDLKVKDCRDGVFMFKPQKKEKSPRAVPIHSALTEIVERRVNGRADDDDFFPEWPSPQNGSLRERSFKASNAFTSYRRLVNVDATVPGKRRALTNFHSFRRWFITEAERADQPEHIIAAVVGHKRQGMTLGRYSAGPLMEQARRCVEAVRLPERDSDHPDRETS
ncbi:tyrosine-type recombinase/integrase [Aurantimonas sp. DM33-3]|uniref:tyrosine-type recombinase/integrase n=1 Tax=Aurantimonas sp. DM33-3 TaxID=2766955 RepID=UPI0032B16200